MTSYNEITRRYAESWLVFLKELKITGTCKDARKNLLAALKNEHYISNVVSNYFKEADDKKPLLISEDEPTQITALKSLLNAILKIEQGMEEVECISIRHDRYTVGILMDAIENSKGLLNSLYEAVELINNSAPEIHAIAGKNIRSLLPKIGQIAAKTHALMPEGASQMTAKSLSSALNRLPSQGDINQSGLAHLSQFLYKLPSHFDVLTDIVKHSESNTLSFSTPSETSAGLKSNKAKQRILLEKIKQAEKQFKDLSDANYMLIPHWLKTLNLLLSHTSTLFNSAAPLTKQTYITARIKLDEIRHKHIPNMLSELEAFEESMGIKPGTLTDPVLNKMDEYYTQLATSVTNIAQRSKEWINSFNKINMITTLIRNGNFWEAALLQMSDNNPDATENQFDIHTNLDQLQDYDFMQAMRDAQVRRLRLHQPKISPISQEEVEAADRFFNKLGEYYSTWYYGNMARLPISDRAILLKDYEVFRSHFKSMHPETDLLIYETLSFQIKPNSNYWMTLVDVIDRVPELSEPWEKNHFNTVLSHKDSFLNSIKATIAHMKQSNVDTEFRSHLINETIEHDGEKASLYTVYKNTPTDPIEAAPSESESLANEKPTLFGQISALQLSEKINTFMTNDFQNFLVSNVDPEILKSLGKPPFTELHKDSSEILIYKRTLNALYSLKECFSKIENLHDKGNPKYTHKRFVYLLELNNALFIDFDNAKKNLLHIAKIPELKPIIHKALDVFAPLKAIPVLGDMILTTPSSDEPSAQENIIKAWEAQQAVVKRHTHGEVMSTITSSEYSAPADQTEISEPKNPNEEAGTLLQQLANKLYQLPETIERWNPKHLKDRQSILDEESSERLRIEEEQSSKRTELLKARANELVQLINQYSFWRPEFLQNLMKTVEKINSQVATIGISSRQVISDTIQLIGNQLGDEILALTDTSEFNLGLIPGTLTESAREKINNFNAAIIENLDIKNAQDKLALLFNNQLINNRISREKVHLENLIADKTHERVLSKLFFTQSEQLDKLSKRTQYLVDGAYDERESTQQIDATLKNIISELIPHYKKLQAQLAEINSKYTKEYLSVTNDADEILKLTQAMLKITLPTEGFLVKMERIKETASTDPNFFSKAENKIEFLQIYNELEPYLTKISKTHGRNYVLIELQKPSDFHEKLNLFVALKEKLMEIVSAERETYQQRIKRSTHRIAYLEDELKKEQNKQTERLMGFKSEIFTKYLNETIKKRYEETMGKYYANFFMKKMEFHYVASQSVMLESISLNNNIESTVHAKLDKLDGTIRQSNQSLIRSCEALNKARVSVRDLINTERSKAPNPLNLQKMAALKQMLSNLTIQHFEADRINKQSVEVQNQLNYYQVFVHLDDLFTELENIENHLKKHPDSDKKINEDKLSAIKCLKDRINNTDDPELRAWEVMNTITSDTFQNTILKNSDSPLKKLFNFLLEKIFGYESQEKKCYLNLQNKTRSQLTILFFNPEEKLKSHKTRAQATKTGLF